MLLSDNEAQLKKSYLQQAPRLLAFGRRFVDESTAEDIVHDVFLKLWSKYPEKLREPGLYAYLLRMVQHACLDYLKHLRVEETYLEQAWRELAQEEIKRAETDEILPQTTDKMAFIYDAIGKLPPKCKEIFVKAYLEEQKHTDIATELNISVRTVEAQIYKALKTLRDRLALMLSIIFF